MRAPFDLPPPQFTVAASRPGELCPATAGGGLLSTQEALWLLRDLPATVPAVLLTVQGRESLGE